ncbi:DEAD/DEAH box helicase [uncultured Desulfobacter sp.]|uniref:DEAD/DEAH box helicase n=1 Tax=uncultured Desulfobacter sp. TaxID=240139 RepID=UPI002AAC09BF|nr:DEAD/DEAH box helicase [uncultured Desulfobacter sp.]
MEENNSKNLYKQLPCVMQRIIQLLCIQMLPFRQKDILACLEAIGENHVAGNPLNSKTIREIIDQLEKQGLVIKSPKGIFCPDSLLGVVQDVVNEGGFDALAQAVLNVSPFQKKPVYYVGQPDDGTIYFNNRAEYLRAVRIAAFSHERLADIELVYKSGMQILPIHQLQDSVFLELFHRPFSKALFDSFPVSTCMKILSCIIRDAIQILAPVEDALAYYISRIDEENLTQKHEFLLTALLLCGKTEILQKILQNNNKSSSSPIPAHLIPSHNACLQMIKGQYAQALELFKQALVLKKSNTRKRNVFLDGYPGLFFILALAASDHEDNHHAALTYIDISKKIKHTHRFAIEGMQTVFHEKIGLPAIDAPDYLPLDLVTPPMDYFLDFLVLSWTNAAAAKKHIKQLKAIADKASDSSYVWLAAEASALLSNLGVKSQALKERADTCHQAMGTQTLTTLIQPVPKWEKDLKSLLNIGKLLDGSRKEAASDGSLYDERMIWLLSYSEKYSSCHITPRVQKLAKNGMWTKGRPVALKNLYDNHKSMKHLTEQDHKICDAIDTETYYTGYRRGYAETYYDFDEEKALPALIGHPLLFFEDDIGTPVEIVEGDPELRVRVENGKISVAMHPTPRNEDAKIQITRETPTRLKLIRFSHNHLQIFQALGKKGMKLPAKAKDMVSKAMESLTSMIPVISDLEVAGGAPGKEIKADLTPHVHVTSHLQGISVTVLIQPIKGYEAYFQPGRGGRHVLAQINGTRVQATRNKAKELERVEQILDACPTLGSFEAVDGQWQIEDPEDALETLFELKNCEQDVILKWPQGEKLKIYAQTDFNHFQLSISKEKDWFKASGQLSIDPKLSLDLKQLMTMLDKPVGRFIPLDDTTFIAITRSLKERLEELKSYSTPHKNGVRFSPFAALAVEELADALGSVESDLAWKNHVKKLTQIVTPQVPSTLQARLRDYQVAGFNWLFQLAHWQVGACLADDMGLGKTVQALAAVLLSAGDGPSLVVAPLSVVSNWVAECRKFAPTLNPIVFGSGDRQETIDSLGPFDLIISTYGLLQIEADKLSKQQWQTVILDEAQAIKNMQTKRSKAAMNLNAKFRIITTGTPIENHLGELWNLFHFLNPGLLGNWSRFKNTFAIPIERDKDKMASRRLQKLIKPFIMRRMKSDVLKDLPEKTEINLEVIMNEQEASLYEARRQLAVEAIENSDGTTGQIHLKILSELTKLRQLCCNPSLILPDTDIESSKLKLFGNLVHELLENNHKVLVFSQFVTHLSILRSYLDKEKITYQYLDGATSKTKREQRINAFQRGESDLFLISLKAGGLGLNLTAADYVIHMDPWWNPAVEDQASDRAHRIGQVRPVTVYRLIMKDTIEDRIVNLHKEKRQLAESLLAGSDASAKISAQELLSLLHS